MKGSNPYERQRYVHGGDRADLRPGAKSGGATWSLGTFATVADAELALVRYNAQLADGLFSLSAAELRATMLKDYLDDWLQQLRLQEQAGEIRRRTLRDYQATIKVNVAPYLGGHRLSDLTIPVLKDWLLRLRQRGLSDRSVQKAYRALHRALGDSGLPENPAVLPKSSRPTVKTRKKVVRPTVEEVAAFLGHVSECDHPSGRAMAALWWLGATTGMRKHLEVGGFGWDLVELDTDPPTVTVERTLHVDSVVLDSAAQVGGELSDGRHRRGNPPTVCRRTELLRQRRDCVLDSGGRLNPLA